ncbi:NAD(P)/FAD-dependent oxidoreductase [Microbacterium sp. EF45047]|uniref:NAD(P)/FAD-dependent oxidoreductase n=1 Tax=Microbacterium sp. EF45047 TaxID=2809708 RepID=UPI002349654C|nr:FAD-dependent oxidoreductase [Microbacterium sp. EF45047]WCM55077.1 FAD-dependent oxidoreductase [Microbacterium sp. EF45047]
MQNNSSIEVVVLGGGYAGTIAANRLTQDPRVRVTLVNARPQFVERVRLHQLVAGSHAAVADFSDLLAPRVRLVVGTVTAIDAPRRTLSLEDGSTLGYDYLVYAVGSATDTAHVPGAADHALTLSTLEEAERLRAVLAGTPDTAPVVVVGAGPLGIEVAAELAERGRALTLVCGAQLGPYLHPRARRRVARRLTELGVAIIEGAGAAAVHPHRVVLDDGRELPSAATVWTVGFAAGGLARRSGLRTDAEGRLLTDETLTSVDDERIVATGDAAAPSGLPMRMSCQAALPLGSHAADTVLSRIAGREPAEWDRAIGAMCISLGRADAVFQLSRLDDTATPVFASGRVGAMLKEEACASPIKQISKEARKPGSHRSPARDRSRAAKLAARSTGTGEPAAAVRESAAR